MSAEIIRLQPRAASEHSAAACAEAGVVVESPRNRLAKLRQLWRQFDAGLDAAAAANPERFPWRRLP